jgi:hypothetical protein
MPRRHAISPERRDKMLTNLRAGGLYRDAAVAAGIPWSTWTDWCRDVRDGTCTDEDVIALVTAAREAYATTNIGLAATLAKASQKDWRAALALMEHRQGDPKARHDEKRARYEAEIARNRSAGTHVETVRHVGEIADEDLDRRIAELEAVTKH